MPMESRMLFPDPSVKFAARCPSEPTDIGGIGGVSSPSLDSVVTIRLECHSGGVYAPHGSRSTRISIASHSVVLLTVDYTESDPLLISKNSRTSCIIPIESILESTITTRTIKRPLIPDGGPLCPFIPSIAITRSSYPPSPVHLTNTRL